MAASLKQPKETVTPDFSTAVLIRVLDLAGSALGLQVLSPLFIFIAVIIKLTSAGPIFYRAERVGLHERGNGLHCCYRGQGLAGGG